jgi:hypothetical protein
MMFVVGDAPAHDGRDGLYAQDLARSAAERGIVVNTIQCGMDPVTASALKDLASAGGGRFTSIDQDGGVVALATPYDDELARLNRQLAQTMIGWGDADQRALAERKLDNRLEMSATRAAEAAGYSAKAGRLADEDLLWALDNGVELDSIDPSELPASLRKLGGEGLEAHVEKVRDARGRIQSRILDLSRDRDAFLEQQEKEAGVDKGFDGQVLEIIREQAAAKGIDY